MRATQRRISSGQTDHPPDNTQLFGRKIGMRRTTIDFGIDLGTTNSTIAVVDGIDARTINNSAGSALTPSAVWLSRRNQLLVGQEPKARALIDDPDNADLEFKL